MASSVDEGRAALRERVATDLRALLMAHGKKGLALHVLRDEYLDLMGDSIPFRKLGHQSLKDMMTCSPDICTISWCPVKQTHLLHGVFVEKTAHVAALKMSEKSTGSKRGSTARVGLPRRPNVNNIRDNGYSNSQGRGNNPSKSRGNSNNYGRVNSNNHGRVNSSSYGKGNSNNNNGNNQSVLSSSGRPVATSNSSSTDFKLKLANLCNSRGWSSPQFMTSKTANRHIGSVRVTERRYNTFPNDYGDENQAIQAVAKLALEVLEKEEKKDVDSKSTRNVDLATLNVRVAEFVRNKPNGLWSSFIEKSYEQEFKESLQKNWVEQLLELGNALITAEFNTLTNRYIVKLKKTVENGELNDVNNNEPDLVYKNESATLDSNSDNEQLPPLILPKENEEWHVIISSVEKMRFYARFVDKDEEFHNLMTDLEIFYIYDSRNSRECIETPQVGKVYVATMETTECHRVRILSVNGDGSSMCSLVDVGRRITVPKGNLRELTEKFAQIPVQAIEVELLGLENHPEDDIIATSKAAAMLMGGQKFKGQVTKSTSATRPHSLVLRNADTGLNCNEALIECIRGNESPTVSPISSSPAATSKSVTTNMTPSASPSSMSPRDLLSTMKSLVYPSVPPVGEFFDVTVISVLDPDSFFVQPLESSAKLRNLQRDMNLFYNEPKNRSSFKPESNSTDLYCALLSPEDGNWYRARMTDMSVDDIHVVTVVDHGRSEHVRAANLQPLAAQFRNLPIQALHAKLYGVSAVNGQWSSSDGTFFRNIVLFKQFVSVIKDRREVGTEGDIALGLSLVDTSDEKVDVYVETLLVDADRAVDISHQKVKVPVPFSTY